MNIYSAPGAATHYQLNLPEINREYWIPDTKLLENEFIATSSAPAGIFRQLVKFDVSTVKRSYRLLLDSGRASVFAAMLSSAQTTFYANNGTGIFEIFLRGNLAPEGSRAWASIEISVNAQVS